MTSSPNSPRSPVRKRRSMRTSSLYSLQEPPSPTVSQNGMISKHSRKSSQSSFYDQFSNSRISSPLDKRPSSSRLSIGSDISVGLGSNAGLGNLADELEEALGFEDNAVEEPFLQELDDEQAESVHDISERLEVSIPQTPRSPNVRRSLASPEKPPSPSKQWASMGTQHKTESFYDGSDYGPSSDDELFDTITPALQRKIRDFEEITRISANADSMSESGGVMARTTSALRDNLGVQGNIESGITRLVTAYTSMSTHRTHQAREIPILFQSLNSQSILGQSLLDLEPEMLDSLVNELDCLSTLLPYLSSAQQLSNSNPLQVLHAFAVQSHDLITSLHDLLDSLTENRQHLQNANRRLKLVRDLVDELQSEEDLIETSILLIQAGDWDRRCRERHAAKAVEEVLQGFKDTWSVDYDENAYHPSKGPKEVTVR